MSYSTLLPLIQKTGSRLSAEDFHRVVNVVFHDVESQFYDQIHAGMWESLGKQVNLLAADLLAVHNVPKSLRLLDIGCGTGLSTDLLLKSDLAKHITDITLLDTSPEMLRRACERSKSWQRSVRFVNSSISSLDDEFDVIMICSVMHHIPDLENFLDLVGRLQPPGGILIHLQDPNGDYTADREFKDRLEKYRQVSGSSEKSGIIPKKIKAAVNNFLGRKTYIDKVNDILISKEAIARRMTAEEIWSVTDIHVGDLPYSSGCGISLDRLKEMLRDYRLISNRSYAFFGALESDLSVDEFRAEEQKLIESGQKNGAELSAIWIKK